MCALSVALALSLLVGCVPPVAVVLVLAIVLALALAFAVWVQYEVISGKGVKLKAHMPKLKEKE